MSRVRQPDDWDRDLALARAVEQRVCTALRCHPEISHLSDFTHEMDVLDFQFQFEQQLVHLDVKIKGARYSDDIAAMWPELPRDDLFIIDETSFRELVWKEGLGYLIVEDRPRNRWHMFGPWELILGPRRRFERRSNKTGTEFLKGKLLLDFRTASKTTAEPEIDELLNVVRTSRRALRHLRAIPVDSAEELPVLPRPAASLQAGRKPAKIPERDGGGSAGQARLSSWAGLSEELVLSIRTNWGWTQLTAVQSMAIPPILQGHNALILAYLDSGA
jgi:hypothetical protein